MDSYDGIGKAGDIISEVQKHGNDVSEIGILITRYSSRASLDQGIAKSIEKKAGELGANVFNTRIRECVAIRKSKFMSQDIFSYAPRSNAAYDFESLVNEFLESEVQHG